MLRLCFIVSCLLAGLSPAKADLIKIGISLPLSGDGASYGSDYRKVYIFANEVLANNSYTLVFEDDRCLGKDAVSAAQKFISVDKIRSVLGVTCDTTFASAGAVYENAGVTVISTSASYVPGKHLFHTELKARDWAKVLFDYAGPRHKSFGVIFEETVFASEFAKNFMALDTQHQLRFERESFLSSDENVKSQLLRISKAAPEAIVIAVQSENSLYRVVKQLHEIGWEKPRYSTFFPGAKSFLAQAGALAEGIVFGDFPDMQSTLNPEGKKLYQEYVKQNGEPSSGAGLFLGAFEAFRAMHLAIQSGKPAEEFLAESSFAGVMGTWRFDRDGFWDGYGQIVKRIEHGKAVAVEASVAGKPIR